MRCPSCNRVEGHAQLCPHCRVETDIVPSPVFRFVCTVCGHARVPLEDPAVERSFAELDDLHRAHRARRFSLGWRLLAATMAAFSFLALVTMALIIAVFEAEPLVLALGAIPIVVPLTLAAFFSFRARRSSSRLKEALDEAWLKVATEHARTHRTAHPGTLADAMRLDEHAALALTAKLSVADLLAEPDFQDSWQRLASRSRVDGTEIPDPNCQSEDAYVNYRLRVNEPKS